jgi:hypothetical protein
MKVYGEEVPDRNANAAPVWFKAYYFLVMKACCKEFLYVNGVYTKEFPTRRYGEKHMVDLLMCWTIWKASNGLIFDHRLPSLEDSQRFF